jgi:hypothetical protein
MIKQSQSAHLDASARSTLFFLDQFSEVFDALFAARVAAQEKGILTRLFCLKSFSCRRTALSGSKEFAIM